MRESRQVTPRDMETAFRGMFQPGETCNMSVGCFHIDVRCNINYP